MSTSRAKYDGVVAEFTRRIAAGELAEGDRVPSLQEFANAFAISLTTADRVMVILKDRKLVRGHPGSRRVVAPGARQRAVRRLAEDADEQAPP